MLPTGDAHVVRDVTFHYCQVSLITYATTLALLYFSNFYLRAGRREFLYPIILLAIIDVCKWLYHKTSIEKDLRQTYRKKPLNFLGLVSKCFDLVHLFKSVVVGILGSFAFHIVAILFGADALSKYEETYIFSLLMSVLTVFPMCLNFGVSSLAHLLSGLKPWNSLHSLLFRTFQSALFGAWAGAVVIPLDWDRPWQMWPIPCSFTALLMSALASLAMYCHMYLVNSNIQFFKKFKC